MKLYKQIFIILIVFLKTETLLSENNLFNVNNIQLEKKEKITNNDLANLAIKKGFKRLIAKILLKQDSDKLTDLNFSAIKQLVTYYQITNIPNKKTEEQIVNFSVTFDKDKIHDLFYKRGISYSEITDKELYILPVLVAEDEIFIFTNNFFYNNWNKIYEDDLIEFILPYENIEIIQNINNNKNNLINLEIENLLSEYSNKNLALILIEKNKTNIVKVYIKSFVQGKKISKSINLKKQNLSLEKINEKIVIESKKELINLVKSENLIDIRTPSFLNAKLDINKKSNLVVLNSRIKKLILLKMFMLRNLTRIL